MQNKYYEEEKHLNREPSGICVEFCEDIKDKPEGEEVLHAKNKTCKNINKHQ
jgi:hypothetical protein